MKMFNGFLYALIILQLLLNFELTCGYPQRSKINEDVCLSPACIHAASRMLNNMDSKVSPCDNFYKYGCGNFIKSTQLSDSEDFQSSFSQTKDKLINDLQSIINLSNLPNDTKPVKIAKDYYQACLNTSAMNQQGLDEMKKIIKNTGGWPVLDANQWDETSFDWIETTYKLSKLGYSVGYLMNVELKPNDTNKKLQTIHLTPPKFSNEINTGKIDKLQYAELMYDIAVVFGADSTTIFKDMVEIIEFTNEIVLQTKFTSSLENRPMVLNELKNTVLPIDWNKYINSVFGSNYTLPDETIVIVESPIYFDRLHLLLDETSNKIIANYIMWNIVEQSIKYLSYEIRTLSMNYKDHNEIDDDDCYNRRDGYCFKKVYNHLPAIMDTIYFTNIFDKNIKSNVTKMADNIKNKLVDVINNKIDYIDNTMIGNISRQVKYITRDIAYSDELIDETIIEELYKDLKVNKTNYLQSSLNIELYKRKLQFRNFIHQRELYVNSKNYRQVNAFYLTAENSIYIPGGILGDIFFNNDYPNYINYGVIGFIISHELTHGFIRTTIKFEKPDNDFRPFINKDKCFIEQYNNYTIEEIQEKANGFFTLEENMADNGGIKLSYLAYKELSKEHGPEPKMPGFESFTPEQMFWLSFANNFCSKNRPELLSKNKKTNPHSSSEHRLIGSLSNNLDFANDFNCPSGSRMNPINKCTLW